MCCWFHHVLMVFNKKKNYTYLFKKNNWNRSKGIDLRYLYWHIVIFSRKTLSGQKWISFGDLKWEMLHINLWFYVKCVYVSTMDELFVRFFLFIATYLKIGHDSQVDQSSLGTIKHFSFWLNCVRIFFSLVIYVIILI